MALPPKWMDKVPEPLPMGKSSDGRRGTAVQVQMPASLREVFFCRG